VGQQAISLDLVAKAIASFERTLIAANSPFDLYYYQRDRSALAAEAIRGLDLFRGRAGCATCHTIGEHSALFTDNLYHRVGVGEGLIEHDLAAAAREVVDATPEALDRLITSDSKVAALGRFVVTKDPKDIGLFKTPSLRNVALTAPYMHDGSVETLAAALDVEVYYRGLEASRPLILTPRERTDLIAFLNSLTSPVATSYPHDPALGKDQSASTPKLDKRYEVPDPLR
jgi:cytochrome c peroxidase